MLDLVIRGGDVVTPQGVGRWDVGIEGERIAALGLPEHGLQAGRVIDAGGMIVVPGGIEPHTHLAHFISMQPEENLHTLGPEEDTRGMVFGGTTTHVDFCFVRPGTDVQQVIETRAARWKGNSYADYSFHVALQGALPITLFDQLPEAVQAGFPSFKVFTVEVLPPHPKRHPYRLDYGRIQLAMEKIAPHNGIMVVHAEDHDIVQFMYEKFREEKQTEGWLLPLVHNKLSEKLAFRRTIQLAAHTGAGVYFVHTSAREGVDAVAEARAGGYPIYAETLHHYACFTAEDYKSPRGFCYHTYPSLKYPGGPGRALERAGARRRLDHGDGRVPDLARAQAARPGPRERHRRQSRCRGAHGHRLLRGRHQAADVARAVRRRHRHERRQDPRPLSARRASSLPAATRTSRSSTRRSRRRSRGRIFTSATTAPGKGGRSRAGR